MAGHSLLLYAVCSCASPTVDLGYPGVDGGLAGAVGTLLLSTGWKGLVLVWAIPHMEYDCLGCLKCAPNGVVGWQAI